MKRCCKWLTAIGAFFARRPLILPLGILAVMCVIALGSCIGGGKGEAPAAVSGAPVIAGGQDVYLADAAVRRALVDVSGLPYEESLSAPFEEAVRQVDYALVQTMLRLSISAEAVVIEDVELRRQGREFYHFQRLRIKTGPDPLPFVAALYEYLKAWVGKASFYRTRDHMWTVSVAGLITHEITLVPDSSVLPEPEETAAGPFWSLRPRNAGERPRLVIVMDDLGESAKIGRELLELPFPVSFAVWPHASKAREVADMAHAARAEILVHMPMEPLGYPGVTPGPGALLSGDGEEAVLDKLSRALARVPHAVGLNNHMGSRFTRNREAIQPVLRFIRERRLVALDSLTHPGSMFYPEARKLHLPVLRRDIFLDVEHNRAAILGQLEKAEQVARITGRAIAIGHPLPETLGALREWGGRRSPDVAIVGLRDLLR